jgi:hypothetical protein
MTTLTPKPRRNGELAVDSCSRTNKIVIHKVKIEPIRETVSPPEIVRIFRSPFSFDLRRKDRDDPRTKDPTGKIIPPIRRQIRVRSTGISVLCLIVLKNYQVSRLVQWWDTNWPEYP